MTDPVSDASPRVASLLPSTTEIVAALGFTGNLVGRSHECDVPAGIEKLPALTEPKLDVEAPSRAIDERVRELVRDGLSVYRVDADALRSLAPDVILTQTQCEVCAASLDDVEAALADWLGARPQLVALEPVTLADVWGDFERVAGALGAPGRGRELGAQLGDELARLGERAAAAPTRPRTACIEWIDPLMSAGNWMPELVALAGGEALLGEVGAHSPWIDLGELERADPDVVVILPCGFDLARTRAELGPLLARPRFGALRAVREQRVFLADGHHFFNRPGPRLVDSLGILCEMLHPERFPAARRGSAWEPL